MSLELWGVIGSWVSCISAVVAVIVALYVHYDSKRPSLVVFLEHDRDNSCMYLAVSNQGNGTAYDISFEGFDYSMVGEQLRPMIHKSFIERGVPTLVPGASRITVIQVGQDMDKYSDCSSDIQVVYQEKGLICKRRKKTDSFVLDYYSFSGSLYMVSEARKTTKALEKIAALLKE